MKKFDVVDVNSDFHEVWKLDEMPMPSDLILLKKAMEVLYFYVYSDVIEEIEDGLLIVEDLEYGSFKEHVKLGHKVHVAKNSRR